MNSSIHTFDLVLEKYRFREPLPEADRRAALRLKSESLRRVLEANGRYGALYGLVLWLFFHARKFGLKLTIVQAEALLAGLAVAASVCAAGGAYGAVRYFTAPHIRCESLPANDAPGRAAGPGARAGDPAAGRTAAAFAGGPALDLVIDDFTGKKLDGAAREHITALVTEQLAGTRGITIGRASERNRSRSSRLLLMGSVDSFGEAYLIHVKIVDSETTRIVFSASEKAASAKDLERAASSIAGKIAVLFDNK